MDRDDDGEPTRSCLDLYNTIKSPLVEWSIYSDCAYRHLHPTFKPTPKIEEVVHMWPDYGDAIFWAQDGANSGDSSILYTTIRTIALTPISSELQEWYNEWEGLPNEDEWSNEKEHKIWLFKGWELAKKVRLLLPESVDLFYDWRPYKVPHSIVGFVEIPHIVPDERTLVKRKGQGCKLPLFRRLG